MVFREVGINQATKKHILETPIHVLEVALGWEGKEEDLLSSPVLLHHHHLQAPRSCPPAPVRGCSKPALLAARQQRNKKQEVIFQQIGFSGVFPGHAGTLLAEHSVLLLCLSSFAAIEIWDLHPREACVRG